MFDSTDDVPTAAVTPDRPWSGSGCRPHVWRFQDQGQRSNGSDAGTHSPPRSAARLLAWANRFDLSARTARVSAEGQVGWSGWWFESQLASKQIITHRDMSCQCSARIQIARPLARALGRPAAPQHDQAVRGSGPAPTGCADADAWLPGGDPRHCGSRRLFGHGRGAWGSMRSRPVQLPMCKVWVGVKSCRS